MYQTIVSGVENFADGFIAVNAKYTPADGGLAEQFDRNSGSPLSARDLTWSYASVLTAFSARKETTPPSWGAKGVVVPSVCHANPGPQVQVTFNVVAHTQFGGVSDISASSFDRYRLIHIILSENIFLTGSLDALRSWSPDNAIALSPAKYPTWSGQLSYLWYNI